MLSEIQNHALQLSIMILLHFDGTSSVFPIPGIIGIYKNMII